MTLKEYLRMEINQKIRPIMMKDKCEICNSVENLEFHHVLSFSDMLTQCLETLNITDSCDIDENTILNDDDLHTPQIENIVYWIIGNHFYNENKTLCKKCHTEVHSLQGGFAMSSTKNRERQNQKKIFAIIEQKIHRDTLTNYLDSIINKRLNKDEREKLIDVIGLRDKYNRLQKSISMLNQYLIDNKYDYVIISKKSNDKRYWIIEHVENF